MTYRQTQHGASKGGLVSEGYKSDGGNNPRTYRIVFPVSEGPRPCLAEGCSGRALMRTAMKVQLWNWHVRDTVVIL